MLQSVRFRRRAAAMLAGALLSLTLVGTASAHFCFVENKPAGAGSGGTFDIVTEEFTPAEHGNGGGAFITIAADGQPLADVFIHIPQGGPNAGSETIPPVSKGVQNNCDGKGLGDALTCG